MEIRLYLFDLTFFSVGIVIGLFANSNIIYGIGFATIMFIVTGDLFLLCQKKVELHDVTQIAEQLCEVSACQLEHGDATCRDHRGLSPAGSTSRQLMHACAM